MAKLILSEDTLRILGRAGDRDAQRTLSNLQHMRKYESACTVQVVYESHWDNINMLVNSN